LSYQFFSEGITNKLVGCWHSGDSINHASQDNVLLIRIYGNNTDLLIDRAAETRNITMLQNDGFAPRLYATFQNGIVYEYVEGRTLTPESVTSPKIWPLIAAQMARMHKVRTGNGTGDSKPMLLEKCRLFFELLPAVYASEANQEL
jgi:ethanolamine kinase